MRSVVVEVAGDRRATLERLRSAIDTVADAGREAHTSLSTGWSAADTPHSDASLVFGALHEWFGLMSPPDSPSRGARRSLTLWTPPLSVLVHLAARARTGPSGGSKSACSVVLWIGRRIWPYGHALRRAHPALFDASICVDAQGTDQRFWSIDVALRCAGVDSGVVVIADASGLPLALSRRLQLAAEAGGSLGLLARPPWEESELSVAATRWRVRTAAAYADAPRWSIELVRCKGRHAHASHAQTWTVERTDDGRLVSASAGVADRPHPAAIAS